MEFIIYWQKLDWPVKFDALPLCYGMAPLKCSLSEPGKLAAFKSISIKGNRNVNNDITVAHTTNDLWHNNLKAQQFVISLIQVLKIDFELQFVHAMTAL